MLRALKACFAQAPKSRGSIVLFSSKQNILCISDLRQTESDIVMKLNFKHYLINS